ncbi:MAG: hypothetical protein R3281_05920 [Balneolaceae bacterium]|nr:hypothetical protein [Balneolaceae bacterium]
MTPTESNSSLGLCFFDNQLFYAVDHPESEGRLARIGSVDFNFDLPVTILRGDKQNFSGIRNTVSRLKDEFGIEHIRLLSFPTQECWTTFPKIVYDKPDEREDHINILMQGIDRSNIEPTWYDLSNQKFKFLLLRNREKLGGMQQLASSASTADLVSDFEIGSLWSRHSGVKGSFMTVGCFHDCIAVSSFVLGKLRGATYLSFDEPEDLPYLWLQNARELSWMNGLHEQIYVYGIKAYRIIDILNPFWDSETADIIKMDSLEKMNVKAAEHTYGFNLECAFPAIMLALGE